MLSEQNCHSVQWALFPWMRERLQAALMEVLARAEMEWLLLLSLAAAEQAVLGSEPEQVKALMGGTEYPSGLTGPLKDCSTMVQVACLLARLSRAESPVLRR